MSKKWSRVLTVVGFLLAVFGLWAEYHMRIAERARTEQCESERAALQDELGKWQRGEVGSVKPSNLSESVPYQHWTPWVVTTQSTSAANPLTTNYTNLWQLPKPTPCSFRWQRHSAKESWYVCPINNAVWYRVARNGPWYIYYKGDELKSGDSAFVSRAAAMRAVEQEAQ